MRRIWEGVILPRLHLGISTYLFASAPEQGRLQRILLSFPHLGAHSTVKMVAILSSLSPAPVCYPYKPAIYFLSPCCDLNTQLWLEVWNWLWCHYYRNLTEIKNFSRLWKIALRTTGLFKYSIFFFCKTVLLKVKSTNPQAQNHTGCVCFFFFLMQSPMLHHRLSVIRISKSHKHVILIISSGYYGKMSKNHSMRKFQQETIKIRGNISVFCITT